MLAMTTAGDFISISFVDGSNHLCDKWLGSQVSMNCQQIGWAPHRFLMVGNGGPTARFPVPLPSLWPSRVIGQFAWRLAKRIGEWGGEEGGGDDGEWTAGEENERKNIHAWIGLGWPKRREQQERRSEEAMKEGCHHDLIYMYMYRCRGLLGGQLKGETKKKKGMN